MDSQTGVLSPNHVSSEPYDHSNLSFRRSDFPESDLVSMIGSGGSEALILDYPRECFGPAYSVAHTAIISSPYGRTVEELMETPAGIPKKAFLTDAVTHP